MIRIVYASILAALLITFNVDAKKSWQHPDYIAQSFLEVALGNEHGKSRNLNLRKWLRPIRIYVEHQTGDELLHDNLLNAHITQLVSITGFDIKRVNNRAQANLYYFFTRQQSLPSLVKDNIGQSAVQYLHGSVCLANIKTAANNEIVSAYIFIPVDQARMHGKLVACIVEELTQILGLVRDSDLVFPSIFNDKSHNMLLTGLDDILLRLLSEDVIKAGMSAQQLRPILDKLLIRYQTSGLIDSAQQRVQQGKLYEMLGYRKTN